MGSLRGDLSFFEGFTKPRLGEPPENGRPAAGPRWNPQEFIADWYVRDSIVGEVKLQSVAGYPTGLPVGLAPTHELCC